MSVLCARAQFATLFYTAWKRSPRVTSSCKKIPRSGFRKWDFRSQHTRLVEEGGGAGLLRPRLPLGYVNFRKKNREHKDVVS